MRLYLGGVGMNPKQNRKKGDTEILSIDSDDEVLSFESDGKIDVIISSDKTYTNELKVNNTSDISVRPVGENERQKSDDVNNGQETGGISSNNNPNSNANNPVIPKHDNNSNPNNAANNQFPNNNSNSLNKNNSHLPSSKDDNDKQDNILDDRRNQQNKSKQTPGNKENNQTDKDKKQNNNKNKDNQEKNKNNEKKESDKKDSHKKQSKDNSSKKGNDKKANPNRSKNMNDVKNRSSNSNLNNRMKNTVNKVKNKASSTAKKGGQTLKNGAKKAGKAVSKVSEPLIEFIKKKVLTNPITWVAIVVIIILFVVILSFAGTLPGLGGDVNDNDNYSKFTEADQKTLDKIRKLFNKYPKADASLAMVTVLYPYFENLHDGNVYSILSTSMADNEKNNEPEIPDVKEDDDDKEELEGNEEDTSLDDVYLLLFRNYTIRTKLKRLLKEQSNGNESYNNYLKNTYFKNDKGYGNFEKDEIGGYNGYKEMFDSIDSSYHDDLANEIIIDLYNKKDWFIDYVFERMVCSSSSTSLGHSDAGELIKGDAVVVLKDTSSTDYGSIKAAEALYGTDDLSLRLKRYVLGVAYSEIGANVKNEAAAKAEMITAQSFLLGRTHPGSGVGVGMNFTPDYNDTQTIFYIRGNTYDQDFCDVYEGCETGSKYAKELIKNDPTGEAHKNTKGKLDDESIRQLEKWYDEIATKFIYDDTNKMFYGVQFSDYNDICKVGACLAQKNAISLSESGSDYNDILFGNKGAFTESRFVLYDSSEGGLSKVSTDCVEMTGEGSCTVPNDKFIYYSQKVGEYSGKTFCGREDATIKSSGCGITAMAMVVANLSNSEVTPDVTNAEAQEGGYCGAGIGGTSAGYFKAAADKYGLKYSSGAKTDGMDMTKATNDINNTLRSGGLVIINVNGNWLNGNSGHYIVAKGIDASDRLIIADPYADRIDNPKRNLLTASEIIKNYVNVNYGWYMFTSDKSMEILNNYCTTIKVNSDGTTTGYLTDPITPTNTNAQTRASLKGNSQSLYYLSGKYHGGTDFPVPIGTPVRAMDGGVVVSNGFSPFGFGRHVVIEHTINNTSYWSVYAHLNSASVSTNDKVSQGQVIGLSGNTGYSSGPHLHVGLTTKRNRLGNSGKGYQYLVLKYIGTNVSYVGQPTD